MQSNGWCCVHVHEQIMAQRDLHEEFLDGGVLGVFKAWIEPMQDGSLPNLKIRSAVLRALLRINFFFEVSTARRRLASVNAVSRASYFHAAYTLANRISECTASAWVLPCEI